MGLEQNGEELIEANARLVHVGNRALLGGHLVNLIDHLEGTSSQNDGQTIYLGLAFGAVDHDRRSKLRTAEYVAQVLKQNPNADLGQILSDDKLDSFSDALGGWQDMDLVIRTTTPRKSWDVSEETLETFHLSGIGQVVGAKTIITPIPKYFPDLTFEDFDSAVLAYANTDRRQGS